MIDFTKIPLMSKTRSYAQILIGFGLFLTVMAIYLSLRVAPLDLLQGGNSRIPYVHVPAARMSILVYIVTAGLPTSKGFQKTLSLKPHVEREIP